MAYISTDQVCASFSAIAGTVSVSAKQKEVYSLCPEFCSLKLEAEKKKKCNTVNMFFRLLVSPVVLVFDV